MQDPKFTQLQEDLDKKYNPQTQQLQTLEDIANIVQELLNVTDDSKKTSEGQIKALGAVLDDSRQQLIALNKKETPEAPDQTKLFTPLFDKLSREISGQLAKLDVKPQVNLPAPQVKVDAPQVNVSPPSVDLKGIEKILKSDIPKAFSKAIGQIPETPEVDQQPILDALSELRDWLKSIDDASRKKPLPGNMGIMANGSVVSTSNPLPTNATFSGSVTTTPTFKDDPTASGETPKFGKTNSSTHKQQVEAESTGNVASGATDSGNPVKIGGKYSSTKPTFTDGQRGDVQLGTRGAVNVQLTGPDSSNQIGAPSAGADGASNSVIGIRTYGYGSVYNGTTWDRQLGNATDGTLVNLGANNDVTVTSSSLPTGAATSTKQSDGSQKTQLVDSSNVNIGSVATEDDNYLRTAFIQDKVVVSESSSTANLASGATFTGTSDSSLGGTAILVSLFADQNCTIEVQQAQEDPGMNWTITDSWQYSASSGGNDAARMIQAVARSFRVRVTNNSGSTTTVFRLQTILAPYADALPRGLSSFGNLNIALDEINATDIATGNGIADDGTQRVTIASNNSPVPIMASSLPLPSGAATSAKQDTGNTSLGSIDSKLSGTIATDGTTREQTGLMPKIYDYISANFAGSTADVYTYKAGGSGGTTAATLTVNWTDSTKTVLSTVVRT